MTIASTASALLRAADDELERQGRVDIGFFVDRRPDEGLVVAVARRGRFATTYRMLDIAPLPPGMARQYVRETVQRMVKALDLADAP